MENLQGHPQVVTGVVLLQPLPLESVLNECRSRKCVGHAAHGGVTTVLSPLSPAGAYLWSWNLCLAVQGSAGVSDCPKVPEVLQDCQIVPKSLTCSGYLELTHWDSIMHHSEHPELKLSLLDRSKVWSREVLNLIQHQPKRYKFVP